MTEQTASHQYADRISQFSWAELLSLWEAIENENTPDWAPGRAFEHLVLRAFQLEGAEICWPFRLSIDEDEVEQVDGVVYADGLACVIECKDTRAQVKVEPIAKLRNQLLRRPITAVGLFFSRSGYTQSAITLSEYMAPQTILLWDGTEINLALEAKCFRRILVTKYRRCIEHGLSHHDIQTEGDLL